jgi:hypothetical protein
MSFVFARATWIITAYNLNLLETRSTFSENFIAYVRTTELPVTAPMPLHKMFLTMVAIMIIWTPNK